MHTRTIHCLTFYNANVSVLTSLVDHFAIDLDAVIVVFVVVPMFLHVLLVLGVSQVCQNYEYGPEGTNIQKIKNGVDYGMEMDSYKSRILDGVLMRSGTKTKTHELVSQIASVNASIFLY
jgi:hypothetical protein